MACDARFASRRPDWRPNDLHPDLNLSSHHDCLLAERRTCPTCAKSRSWYCPTCHLILCDKEHVPKLELPFQIRIVTHPGEKKKCTGVQAVLLAPDHAELVDHEDVSNSCQEIDPKSCALLFPSEQATTPDVLDVERIKQVYVIDTRWKKAKSLVASRAEYSKMQHVRLTGDLRSAFWRYHTKNVTEDGLCTIEALHFFMRQLQENPCLDEKFKQAHYFDDLMWMFAMQHRVVSDKFEEKKRKRMECASAAKSTKNRIVQKGDQTDERATEQIIDR